MSLDDRPSGWRGVYGDPAVAIISVGAVGAVHGMVALADHPALEPLRSDRSRLEPRTN